MNLQKASVTSAKAVKWMQRLADTGAVGPAAADTGGEGDDCNFAPTDCLFP